MVCVEVILEDSVEIWNLPSIPNLHWMDDNVVALRIVYDDLKRRARCASLDLSSLQISARNPEYEAGNSIITESEQ
jgi:hypothetical protein